MRKITFIGFSILNRLCMKLEKFYRHIWKILGVIITPFLSENTENCHYWKNMTYQKNLWKSLKSKKSSFGGFSIINEVYMKHKIFFGHMWHFWGGHYHIRLSKVPIFDKIIVENELTRAGSLEKNISKNFFGDFLDFRPRKWNKKKYRIDGLAAKNFHMPKMWYFSLFRPIFPPCGGWRGENGQNLHFPYF